MNTYNTKLFNSALANKTYIVGGAVRDMHLRQPITDADYVVEATEEEFRKEFPNAEMVGIDFPVFLIDGDEVALTRTERSNGKGYGAFEVTGVGVSVEEDLQRRDFTINAMARNIVTGKLVDPLNGRVDLATGTIRTTHKNSFGDDPVRILRAFRFAARYGFELSDETFMEARAFSHNLDNVTGERFVLELEKLWKQAKPGKVSKWFETAMNTKALNVVFPELVKSITIPAGGEWTKHQGASVFKHTMKTVDKAHKLGAPFHVGMAMLLHDMGKVFTPHELLPRHNAHEDRSETFAHEFLARFPFSKRVNEFAPKAAKLHMKAHNVTQMTARKLAKFAIDLGRRDFDDMMTVFECDSELSKEQHKVFRALRQVLFELDLSAVAEAPAHARKDKAHQLRVSFLKAVL